MHACTETHLKGMVAVHALGRPAKDGRTLMQSLARRNTEPLIPSLMEGPDEEADESGLLGKLGANDGTGIWKRDVAAFEENLLEDFGGQAVQGRLALHRVCSHDLTDRFLRLGASAEGVAGRVQPLSLLLLLFLLLFNLLHQL